MVACIEEIAYRLNYITAADLEKLGRRMESSSYGEYLLRVVERD
jgi:glucose-1-phosphate thymidylyltransferase